MMASESEPFITFKDDESDLGKENLPNTRRKPARWGLTRNLLIHLGLVALYTTFTIVVLRFNWKSCRTIYSDDPIKDLDIQYKPKSFIDLVDSPYAKQPGSGTDNAWEKLLGNMHIRVTAEELARHNQTSVALTEGGQYLAWLEVFHELHCINMLRKWLYREHYFPNITSTEYTHWSSHADHCLDMLRQASLCHVDTSLTTFVWNETKSQPMFDVHMAPRTCVDFDRVVASTQDRLVEVEEIERLQNPLMTSVSASLH